MQYLAKSEPQKTIAEHTANLRYVWRSFLSVYPEAFDEKEQKMISLAIEYHDLGKLNKFFQSKIINSINGRKSFVQNGEIPHGFLSCAYMDKKNLKKELDTQNLKILMTAIYNHHTREDNYDEGKLKKYIAENLPESYRDEVTGQEYHLTKSQYFMYIIQPYRNRQTISGIVPDEKVYLRYIIVKGMLNRADYAASAEMKEMEIAPAAKDFFHNKIKENLAKKGFNLRPVQEYMSQHQDDNLVVIAATGCGKTEAALLWLDGYKSFYTLPLKVSINAIYERICTEYGYDNKKITLLHSGMLSYYLYQKDENAKLEIKDSPLDRQKKAKLLSFPLTVCTVDQLFYFVFKAMGTEMVPATLKYSHLIIDEIQMYSPDILADIIYGLKIITQLGGKFSIITATFPPVLEQLLKDNDITFLPPSEKYFVDEYFGRHKIRCIEGEFNHQLILEKGRQYKVLVLCNTVSKAQEVYAGIKRLAAEEGANVTVKLLHSHFIRKDRTLLENVIIEDAKPEHKEKVIWISTQIVEASLDISYDILFTEMSPADSLLQRMGRCSRIENYRGKYLHDEPNVYIYNTGNGIGCVYPYQDINDASWDLLKKYDNKIFTEKDKFAYVDEVYDVKKLEKSKYYKDIEKRIETLEKLLPNSLNLKEAKDMFRNIQSVTLLPDVLYNDEPKVKELIEILSTQKKMKLIEQLKYEEDLRAYTVDIASRSLRGNKGKYVDVKPVVGIEKLDLHRTYCLYDFDENKMTGAGLIMENIDETNNIL